MKSVSGQAVETTPTPPMIARRNARMPFAARVQGILVAVMFVSLAMITQQANKSLYRIGLPLLMLSAFLQIAFGNISPRAGFRRSMALLVLTWVITGVVFVASVKLAPRLIDLSR